MKNTFVQLVRTALINSGRTRARAELLRMSDTILKDTGFSRALLLQGNQAWPWRLGTTQPSLARSPMVAQPAVLSTRVERKAIEELRAMSNAELEDIGITRGEIKQVVRHGRVGFEQPGYQSAA